MTVEWSKNLYDKDGDIYEEGIYIHFNQNTILRLENLKELDHVIQELKICRTGVAEAEPLTTT